MVNCHFIDGAAQGVALTLNRTPMMLRVVVNSKGGWDALDELNDTPLLDETIHVYYTIHTPSRVHVKAQTKKLSGWSLWLHYQEYRNPGDQHLRTTEAWNAWVDTKLEFLTNLRREKTK